MGTPISVIFSKALQAHKSGRLNSAAEGYLEILSHDKSHADANHNLGILYVQFNRLEESVVFLRRAIDLKPSGTQFWITYVTVLIKQNKEKEAYNVIKKALKAGARSEDCAVLLCNIGSLLKEKNHLSKSVESYQEALKVDSRCAEALFNIASHYQDSARGEDALIYYRQFLDVEPESCEAHNNIGTILRNQGLIKDSIKSCKKALAINKNHSSAYNNLGLSFYQCDDFNNAKKSFSAAIQLDCSDPSPLCNLANTFQSIGKYDDGVRSCKKALKIDPEFYEAYVNMASNLWSKGVTQDALEAYAQALKIVNKKIKIGAVENVDPQWILDFGDITLRQKDYKKALQIYKTALQIDENNLKAKKNIGILFYRGKDYARALEWLESVSDRESVAKRLECFYHLNRSEDFNQLLRQTAKSDPENIGVAAMSGFASHQLGTSDIYPFCPDPMEQVYVSNLDRVLKDSAQYIEDLLAEVGELENVWEPQEQTIKLGYQTQGNIFNQPTPRIAELEKIIKEELNLFYQKFASKKCAMITSWPGENSKLIGWRVRLVKGGHHVAHIHPSGWVSGVVYLKTCQERLSDSGAIELSLRGFNFPVKTNDFPTRVHRPSAGDILLFPSSLFHKTIPVAEESERVVVAFDLSPIRIDQ